MILERTFSRLGRTNAQHRFSFFPWVLVAALTLTNTMPSGAEDSTTEGAQKSATTNGESSATATTNGQPSTSATTSADLPAGSGDTGATTGDGQPASGGEPPATGNGQPPGDGQPTGVAQPKPLPLIPEIQRLPTIKIPPRKLALAILMPNFEQFHRAFTKYGREYSNRRLSVANDLMRAKLQKNGCYLISEEAAHASSAMVMEIYLTRAKTAINLLAHGYQINGGISRYKRTPGRLVRIGYNSLGEFDQLYSIDDFESKVLMLTDVFLDRTKNIRKGIAAGGKKPAKQGKKP